MTTSSSDSTRGFSLVELLVVISVLLLLSGLTFSGLRSMRTHQVMKQSTSRLQMLLELGQSVAASGGESVYFAIADHESEPEEAAMRAYLLFRNLENPEMIQEWEFLPEGAVFAQDETPVENDLTGLEARAVLENPFPEEDHPVQGTVRVLVELTPGGTLLSGPGRELLPVSLLLERGEWLRSAGGPVYVAQHTQDAKTPYDALRILFRPRSGVLRVEEVLP